MTATTDEITLANRLSLAEAGRELGVSPSTVYRWIAPGMHGVRLNHLRIGRRVFTSAPALERFGRELAAVRLPG